jgi:peptide/nickel transport system ATP-binding protein
MATQREQTLKDEPLVEFREICKGYERKVSPFSKAREMVRALDGVSFKIFPGEIFSLVGESGSGKTTCARLLVRLEEPSSGSILFRGGEITGLSGRGLKEFRRQVQMIFQDPYQSLNPYLTVYQSIVEPLIVHSLGSRAHRNKKVLEILKEVGLTPAHYFFSRFPHQLSGGQRQRVAVARALVLDPELLIADEPVSMLDASVQAQLLNMFLELREKRSLTMLFITHDLATARYLSDRVAVIYRGRIVEHGPTEDVINDALHPYTQALIQAVPQVRARSEQLPVSTCPIEQMVRVPQRGCIFSPRCPHSTTRCMEEEVKLKEIKPHHYAACFLFDD